MWGFSDQTEHRDGGDGLDALLAAISRRRGIVIAQRVEEPETDNER